MGQTVQVAHVRKSLLSCTTFVVAVLMVKTNNDIYRNNVNFVAFLFRKIESPVGSILWFQASGSIFFPIKIRQYLRCNYLKRGFILMSKKYLKMHSQPVLGQWTWGMPKNEAQQSQCHRQLELSVF